VVSYIAGLRLVHAANGLAFVPCFFPSVELLRAR
jgi:hypothetical protein